ncbi:MAG: transglycosylase domain-containing protein [Bdellovibrionales bacterium]|nr:transglycosylase domain-containing protein [Bdellovibrionales bacterium]
MLHPFFTLIVVGLLSIHQYMPIDNLKYRKYFDDVRDVQDVNVFSVANQTCLYLKDIFIDVGLEKTLGSNLANNIFGDVLKQELIEDSSFQSVIDILKNDLYSNKLRNYGLDSTAVIDFLKKLCKNDFSPFDFSPIDRKNVLNFIEKEIHILSEEDLNSFGKFSYFGTLPLLSRKGRFIGSLNPISRKWLSYNEIPKPLILALLASEDRRFFVHQGADEFAISRIAKLLISNEKLAGGSTLTMQLLKNMYFEQKSSENLFFREYESSLFLRKVREWYWAKIFEKKVEKRNSPFSSKKLILEYYFNLIDFGNNVQGIAQASQVYFSKPVQDISLGEAAYLVTLLKGPYKYSNPDNYESHTKDRRDDYVLNRVATLCSQIHRSEFLTDNKKIRNLMRNLCKEGTKKIDVHYIEREKERKLPLWESAKFLESHDSIIPIKRKAKRFLNTVKPKSPDDSKELTVQTTLDENLQKILFQVMREYLDEHDQEKNKLHLIKPIKIGSNKKMGVLSEDIDYSLNRDIKTFLNLFNQLERKWLYSIQINLGPLNPISFNNSSAELAKQFLNQFNFISEEQIADLVSDIKTELLKQQKDVGTLLFIELKKDHFSLFTLEDMLENQGVIFSFKEKKRWQKILSVNRVQNSLYKRALARVYALRSRPDLEPVLYLGENFVISRDLERVFLKETYLAHLKTYSQGDFFWAKKENNNTYSLQSEKIQGAALIIDSHTGEVLANFDGYNPKNNYFFRSFESQRQIGSIIKPFIYLYALDERGYHPQSILNNYYVSIPTQPVDYIPQNFSERLLGPLALFKALTDSQNIATVSLLQDSHWGRSSWENRLKEFMSFFQKMGLYQYEYGNLLYPSFLLGSKEESLSQIVSSFSIFSNGSYIVDPFFIKHVKGYKGSYYYKKDESFYKPSLKNPSSLFKIQSLLLQTANTGTANNLNTFMYNLQEGQYRGLCFNNLLKANHQACLGAKTGTSDKSKDLWFVGFSKNFLIGIWLGYDLQSPIGWSSSKLSYIFETIVRRGRDYLPEIEPILEPKDKPFSLEKRVVFGNTACSDPSENESSYVIYTDKNAPEWICNESYLLSESSQSLQNEEINLLPESTQSLQNEGPINLLPESFRNFQNEESVNLLPESTQSLQSEEISLLPESTQSLQNERPINLLPESFRNFQNEESVNLQIENSCLCFEAKESEVDSEGQVLNIRYGYTLDIQYNGNVYENQGFYNSLEECKQMRDQYVLEGTEVKVCD